MCIFVLISVCLSVCLCLCACVCVCASLSNSHTHTHTLTHSLTHTHSLSPTQRFCVSMGCCCPRMPTLPLTTSRSFPSTPSLPSLMAMAGKQSPRNGMNLTLLGLRHSVHKPCAPFSLHVCSSPLLLFFASNSRYLCLLCVALLCFDLRWVALAEPNLSTS